MNAIRPIITSLGLAAATSAQNLGIKLRFVSVALGQGEGAGANRDGYDPDRTQGALKGEFGRWPLLGADQTAANETVLQFYADGPAEGWVREVGFYAADPNGGPDLLAMVWSERGNFVYASDGTPLRPFTGAYDAEGGEYVGAPMAYKSSAAPLALALSLTLDEFPADLVQLTLASPSINLTIIGPFAMLATNNMRIMRKLMATDAGLAIAKIQSTWR